MLSDDRASSQQQRLLARIAHRYYVANQTQEEIGREFGFSRPKVQRLLDRARQTGIVDIRIAQTAGLNLALEDDSGRPLASWTRSLHRATPTRTNSEKPSFGAAADYLELRLPPGAVVAVGMGRNTGGIARFYRPTRRLDRTFVSAMGGSSDGGCTHEPERDMSRSRGVVGRPS